MAATEPARATPLAARKAVWAWAAYDWANSAYSALSITILVAYIKLVVSPGAVGNLIWSWGISASMLLAAFLAPIVGAMADARSNKRTWLAATAFPGSLLAVAIAFVPEDAVVLVTCLFVTMSLCFELSLGFYNGFLPEIAPPEKLNRVSAFGFSAGYVGGGLALLLAVVVLGYGQVFGLPDGTALTKDVHRLESGTFEVAVENGRHDVSVLVGDPANAREAMQITIEGATLAPVSTGAGETRLVETTTDVRDGAVTIKFEGGEDGVSVAGIHVAPKNGALMPALDFGTAGSDAAAGHVWVLGDDAYESRALSGEGGRLSYAENDVVNEVYRVWPTYTSVPELPTEEAGLEVAFGWKNGSITARDAVQPIRFRIGILVMGLWWGVFTIPTIWVLRDRGTPVAESQSPIQTATHAVREVKRTLVNVRRYPILAIFLVAFLIYNDGVQTVISQASVFAIDALEMATSELILVVLMIQFLALPGAWTVGRLADLIGQKQALVGCLVVWVGLLVAAYFVTTRPQFWIMGVVLAMVMGGTQSVSRAIMGMMTPEARSAEFFGFYNLSGKATSFLGPFLFGLVMLATGKAHLAILSLLAFFLIGLALVARVDVARGRREAVET